LLKIFLSQDFYLLGKDLLMLFQTLPTLSFLFSQKSETPFQQSQKARQH
jgi:hypothetical protein